ncbi:MAG: PEP-CTERM sorting domain-containing protein [Bryobacteraceae bacterium]
MRTVALAAFCLLALLDQAGATPTYTVVDLGAGTATAINAGGSAAGWFSDPFGNYHAFLSAGGTRTDLGAGTQAFAIDSAGNAYGHTFDGNGDTAATRWSAGGAATPIAGAGSSALGVNGSGAVAGSSGGVATVFPGASAGPAGASWSAAYGINDGGATAGTGLGPGYRFGAFVDFPGIGPVWLPSLGGANAYGAAINGAGVVAGTAQASSGYQHAAAWTGGIGQDLGTLGGNNSGAYGINGAGDIVGYSQLAGGESAAFLYSNGSLLNLNLLIDPTSGWLLETAFAINESGQIAGTGLLDGTRHAFLLDPGVLMAPNAVPEPSTTAMMLLALVLVGVPILSRK